MSEMKKLGIVLNGGGGKGSYQIGVWKYMTEIGFDKYISVYAGSSVGALNAVLFANGDYDVAKSIWLCDDLKQKILYHTSIKQKLSAKSLFGRDGLKDIIGSINLEKIKALKTVYATCSYFNPCIKNRSKQLNEIPVSKAESLNTTSIFNTILSLLQGGFDMLFSNLAIDINSLSSSDIIKVLLASSALPFIFPKERLFGQNFYDGGLSDNSPVYPLIHKEHCSDIVVLHLNERSQESTYRLPSVHDIFPSRSLGSFRTGTLNFSRENAEQNIELGYNDARTVYASMLDEVCEKYAA